MYATYVVGFTTKRSATPTTALRPAQNLRIFPKILSAPFVVLAKTTSVKNNFSHNCFPYGMETVVGFLHRRTDSFFVSSFL